MILTDEYLRLMDGYFGILQAFPCLPVQPEIFLDACLFNFLNFLIRSRVRQVTDINIFTKIGKTFQYGRKSFSYRGYVFEIFRLYSIELRMCAKFYGELIIAVI